MKRQEMTIDVNSSTRFSSTSFIFSIHLQYNTQLSFTTKEDTGVVAILDSNKMDVPNHKLSFTIKESTCDWDCLTDRLKATCSIPKRRIPWCRPASLQCDNNGDCLMQCDNRKKKKLKSINIQSLKNFIKDEQMLCKNGTEFEIGTTCSNCDFQLKTVRFKLPKYKRRLPCKDIGETFEQNGIGFDCIYKTCKCDPGCDSQMISNCRVTNIEKDQHISQESGTKVSKKKSTEDKNGRKKCSREKDEKNAQSSVKNRNDTQNGSESGNKDGSYDNTEEGVGSRVEKEQKGKSQTSEEEVECNSYNEDYPYEAIDENNQESVEHENSSLGTDFMVTATESHVTRRPQFGILIPKQELGFHETPIFNYVLAGSVAGFFIIVILIMCLVLYSRNSERKQRKRILDKLKNLPHPVDEYPAEIPTVYQSDSVHTEPIQGDRAHLFNETSFSQDQRQSQSRMKSFSLKKIEPNHTNHI